MCIRVTVNSPSSSINGVKEMKDFRRTFNISYTSVTVTSSLTNETVSAQCSSEDDIETSALLVHAKSLQCMYYELLHVKMNFVGCHCISVFSWCSGWCPGLRAAV